MSEVEITVCGGEKEERIIHAPVGARFLQLLKMHGYGLVCCEGKGTCGRCRVRFEGGGMPLPTAADRIALTAEELRAGLRLACMHRVKGPCRLRVEYVHPGPVEVVTAYQGRTEAPDKRKGVPWLMAIDLGTTTIAMNAVEAESLRRWRPGGPVNVLAQYCVQNPQRAWGSDVISRMQAAQAGEAEALTWAVEEALRTGIAGLKEQMEMPPGEICLAGNTTMEHLLMGLNTETLGKYPFRPVTLKEQTWNGVRLLPGISAFVGADILAGLLACGFGEKRGGYRLFLDLGTNGEMAVGGGGRLICTATAAGPAFEGGAGANVPGTDMIALLFELYKKGILDATGLLCEEMFEHGWQEGELRLTQQDIRMLQMAKAAVRSGVEILMRRMGIGCSEIEEVYLAGGFGYYLDVPAAVGTGLLPRAFTGRITAVGNTSLLGAALYGANPGMRQRAERLCRMAEVINLAEEPDFEKIYLDNLNIG